MSDDKHCELCGASYVVTPRSRHASPTFRFMCPNPDCDTMNMYRKEELSAEEEAEWRLGGENETIDWFRAESRKL